MKVSIIIPTYNAAAYLKEAVASALTQGEVVKEIIIVDNNSTDTSRELAHKLAAEHPSLIRTISEQKQGCSAARNAGLAIAKSDWIQFLDADDVLLTGKLADQIGLIDEYTDWIIAGYQHQYPDGSTEVSIPNPDPWRGLVHNFAIGNTCANLYRKTALLQIGGWREDLPDNTDHHLHFSLLRAGVPYRLDPEIRMTYCHFNQDRVSTRAPLARMERKVQFHARVNQYLTGQKPDYWQEQQPFFTATLVRALRMLATLNVDLADRYYQRYFRNQLPALDLTIASRITRLYPLLGFAATEKLRLAIAPFLAAGWKERMKRR